MSGFDPEDGGSNPSPGANPIPQPSDPEGSSGEVGGRSLLNFAIRERGCASERPGEVSWHDTPCPETLWVRSVSG